MVKKNYFYPEEISSLILKELKKYAEDYLGKEVKDAVDEVVLVGGSSRILKIQKMIKEFFNNNLKEVKLQMKQFHMKHQLKQQKKKEKWII